MQILVPNVTWTPNLGNVIYDGVFKLATNEGQSEPVWYHARSKSGTATPAITVVQKSNPKGATYIHRMTWDFTDFNGSTNNRSYFYPVSSASNLTTTTGAESLSVMMWVNKTQWDAIQSVSNNADRFFFMPARGNSLFAAPTDATLLDIIANDYEETSLPLATGGDTYANWVKFSSKRLATEVVNGETWIAVQPIIKFSWKSDSNQKPNFQQIIWGIGNYLRSIGSGSVNLELAGLVVAETDVWLNPYVNYPFE